MIIRLGYDIQFQVPTSVAMVALLNVHPSRAQDLLEPDELQLRLEQYLRDELVDIERQIASDREVYDA
jgi:hypothetical protein